VTLPPEEVEHVRAALQRYRRAVADLDSRAMRGIEQLRAYLGRTGKGGK